MGPVTNNEIQSLQKNETHSLPEYKEPIPERGRTGILVRLETSRNFNHTLRYVKLDIRTSATKLSRCGLQEQSAEC